MENSTAMTSDFTERRITSRAAMIDSNCRDGEKRTMNENGGEWMSEVKRRTKRRKKRRRLSKQKSQ